MWAGYFFAFSVVRFKYANKGIGARTPIAIVKTQSCSRFAPIISPATAGPAIPEIHHCKLVSALARPRICSGASSCVSAGLVGAWTISPNAKIN